MTDRRWIDFKTVVFGTLTALAIWQVGTWAWLSYGWSSLLVGAGVVAVGNAAHTVAYWFDGRRGLGQWPNPHGRFYDEWMGLPDGSGDYYDWLAQKMGNREPWKTWADLDRGASG